jgi:thymidylate synthase
MDDTTQKNGEFAPSRNHFAPSLAQPARRERTQPQLWVPKNDGESEEQYLRLVEEIIAWGEPQADRTGVGTLALHGRTLRFDLSDGSIPLLTTKAVPFRVLAEELFWFLRGETNIRPLLLKNVHIWSEWPHAAYVKKTGDALSIEEFERRVIEDEAFAARWGDLGPVYGKNWRRWAGPDGKIYDQISMVLERMRKDPGSRRLLFHGWNVAEIDQMALPPCHLLYQFFIARGRLSLSLYQRSCDVALGLPFNLASAATLLRMFAQQTDLEPGELFWVGHDVHLYKNHVDPIQEQLDRLPKALPKLILKGRPESLFDYTIENFATPEYRPAKKIVMPVAV